VRVRVWACDSNWKVSCSRTHSRAAGGLTVILVWTAFFPSIVTPGSCIALSIINFRTLVFFILSSDPFLVDFVLWVLVTFHRR